MINILVSWSGGKDSTLALAALQADPGYRVLGLLTTLTRDYDRISMHGVRRSCSRRRSMRWACRSSRRRLLQAPPMPTTRPPSPSPWDRRGALARPQAHRLRRPLPRRRARVSRAAPRRVGLDRRLSPLGTGHRGAGPAFCAGGLPGAADVRRHDPACRRVCRTGVRPALLAELPPTVDPCGERGEFHTCVYAGPLFARPLPLVTGDRVRRDGRFEYCDVLLEPAATAAA